MEHSRIAELVRRAIAATGHPEPPLFDREGVIPVAHYQDPARLSRERQQLFRKLPIPLAATAELGEPGATLVRELDGVSLLLVRDKDGAVRGFKNSCRHRGTRLTQKDCVAKAFVCPYHGWAYGLDGGLRHVPHLQAFPTLDIATSGLVPVPVQERHGLVWVALDPSALDVAAHLGELDDELPALSLHSHYAAQRVTCEQRGNWKMLMEAFLEGYHIRNLHRTTIYPYFFDASGLSERSGRHIRHASVRRTAAEVAQDPALGGRPLRELATYVYVLFPCTVLIFHPDWTSHVVVQPLAPDRFLWSHTQLIPTKPETEKAQAHFARSFALIEGQVFQREDLHAIAEMQEGLKTDANVGLRFGLLETPALWLHDGIRELLGD